MRSYLRTDGAVGVLVERITDPDFRNILSRLSLFLHDNLATEDTTPNDTVEVPRLVYDLMSMAALLGLEVCRTVQEPDPLDN